MLDDSPALVVSRTIDVGIGTSIELRVPRSVALMWHPEFALDDRFLAAAADGRACYLVYQALRAGRVHAGTWRATFTGGDAVELEAAT